MLKSLNPWSKASSVPAPFPFAQALKAFETDLASVQSLDQVTLGAAPRPAEVEVHKVGSLRSTPEGCTLRLLESDPMSLVGPSTYAGHVESYTLDTVNGNTADYSRQSKESWGI